MVLDNSFLQWIAFWSDLKTRLWFSGGFWRNEEDKKIQWKSIEMESVSPKLFASPNCCEQLVNVRCKSAIVIDWVSYAIFFFFEQSSVARCYRMVGCCCCCCVCNKCKIKWKLCVEVDIMVVVRVVHSCVAAMWSVSAIVWHCQNHSHTCMRCPKLLHRR